MYEFFFDKNLQPAHSSCNLPEVEGSYNEDYLQHSYTTG